MTEDEAKVGLLIGWWYKADHECALLGKIIEVAREDRDGHFLMRLENLWQSDEITATITTLKKGNLPYTRVLTDNEAAYVRLTGKWPNE